VIGGTDRDLVSCPVCGGDHFSDLFVRDANSFVRCRTCGLILINPQPTLAEVDALYGKDYYEPWGLDEEYVSVSGMKAATFDLKLRCVEKYRTKGRLLDVGCAAGFSLEAAVKRGWDAYGVELSGYSASLAQERFGKERVFSGTLDQAGFERDFFDAVFMVDVIEHVKDLDGFMANVWRILKKQGIAAIVTPDAGSFSYKLMGRSWPHIKGEHLYYFSASTLQKLLEKHGFRLLSVLPSLKVLTVGYAQRHFLTYRVPFLSVVVKATELLTPAKLGKWKCTVRTGELFAIAQKITAPLKQNE